MHTFTKCFLGDNVKVEVLTAPALSHPVPGRPRRQRANNPFSPPNPLATNSDASRVEHHVEQASHLSGSPSLTESFVFHAKDHVSKLTN